MKNSERDFIGYGANLPVIQWPNNARIAVAGKLSITAVATDGVV